jgi:hypothetical protein
MRKLISFLCAIMLAGSALAVDMAVTDMAIGPVASYEPPQIDAQWDMLYWQDVQATLANQLLLGGAYAGGYFWITGGGLSSATTTDNRIYRLTAAGAVVDSILQPNVGSGWGFRDMAFDGTYLYGGCESTIITAWDLTGAMVPSMNATRPSGSTLVRALAYDPITDSFWTGNFGSALFNFTRTGTTIWTGPAAPLTAVYGMVWDATGPWLWIYDQTGTPGTKFHQFNPTTHAFTGVTYNVPLFGGLTANIAGGAEWSDSYSAAVSTIVAVGQGTAFDNLYVLEMYPTGGFPDIAISMVPVTTPILIPPGGGSFDWNGTVTNNETTSQTFDVWVMVTLPNQAQYGPVLGPITLTLAASGSLTRLRTQAIPATAPAGSYTYTGKVGDYPSAVYDFDSFPFSKSAVGDGGWVGEWANTGESFESSVAVTPAEFALQGNYPNPFNPTTTINYSLGGADNVTLSVYDLSGRLVSTLVDGYRNAGTHAVSFDATGLTSGVYVYRLTAGAQTASAKMILSK